MCETFASDDISEIFQNSNKCALYIRSILVFFFFFFFFFEMKRKENRHYLKVAARLFIASHFVFCTGKLTRLCFSFGLI